MTGTSRDGRAAAATVRPGSMLNAPTRLTGLATAAGLVPTALVAVALLAGAALLAGVALVAGAGAPWAATARAGDPGDPGVRTPAALRTPDAPGSGHQPPRQGRADPGCQVYIGDVRIAGYRSNNGWIRAVGAGASLACRLPVRNMSLQVTLWKAGLLYDHKQAQTTVRAAAGRYLGSYSTNVACKDQTTSRFFGVAHAVVYFGGRRGDAWVKSPRTSRPQCGT